MAVPVRVGQRVRPHGHLARRAHRAHRECLDHGHRVHPDRAAEGRRTETWRARVGGHARCGWLLAGEPLRRTRRACGTLNGRFSRASHNARTRATLLGDTRVAPPAEAATHSVVDRWRQQLIDVDVLPILLRKNARKTTVVVHKTYSCSAGPPPEIACSPFAYCRLDALHSIFAAPIVTPDNSASERTATTFLVPIVQ